MVDNSPQLVGVTPRTLELSSELDEMSLRTRRRRQLDPPPSLPSPSRLPDLLPKHHCPPSSGSYVFRSSPSFPLSPLPLFPSPNSPSSRSCLTLPSSLRLSPTHLPSAARPLPRSPASLYACSYPSTHASRKTPSTRSTASEREGRDAVSLSFVSSGGSWCTGWGGDETNGLSVLPTKEGRHVDWL